MQANARQPGRSPLRGIRRVAAAAAMVAATLAATTAHAAIELEGMWSDMTFDVVDLTPDDGEEAGFTFVTGATAETTLYVGTTQGGVNHSDDDMNDGFFQPVDAFSAHGAQIAETVSSRETFLGSGAPGSASSAWYTTTGLQVAANTQLNVSVYLGARVSDHGMLSDFYRSAGLGGKLGWVPTGGIYEYTEDGLGFRFLTGEAGGDEELQTRLTFTILSGAETRTGRLSMFMSAHTTVMAVPEPSTYALFGAGLALIGWAARRRQKSQ